MPFLSTLLISVLVTITLIPPLGSLAVRLQLLDQPGGRKVHAIPIPRCGGIAMALGALTPLIWWYGDSRFMQGYLVGAAVIILFGILDDFHNLKPVWKLVGQIGASLIVILWGGVEIVTLGSLWPENIAFPVWIGLPLTLVALVGVTNAINLADGLDGLAGGISLLILASLGLLAYLAGSYEVGLACLALSGAIFGFLRFNTHPATIFMGDTGSQLLGFSAIVFSLHLTQEGTAYSPLLPLIILGFPVLDTVTVMIGRIREGRSPFSPDRNHFHHTLLKLGFLHSESVQLIYVIQAFLILVAFFFRYQNEWQLLALYSVFSWFVLRTLYRAKRHHRQPVRHPLLIKVKRQFRLIRDNRTIIRYAFLILRVLFGGLLLVLCGLPGDVPFPAAVVSLVVAIVLVLCVQYIPGVLTAVLPVVLYVAIPFLIFWNGYETATRLPLPLENLWSVIFFTLAVAGVAVSLFSTREGGFKSTPLDFLVIFLVLVVPNLPNQIPENHVLGLMGMKIIILYYSCELLLREQRGGTIRLSLVTAGAAALLVCNYLISYVTE